jgi:hypothetical protein
MTNLFVVSGLESLVDIEIYVPCEVVQGSRVFVNQLLKCLQQKVLTLLLLLQQIDDHDATELSPDVTNVFDKW